MLNFIKLNFPILHATIWKPYALMTKVYTSVILFFTILFSGMAVAQTFPSASSCTSKDLILVAATLTGGDACNTCTPGNTVTRTLTLSINNKTGSTRTSFAFWGTLEIYNPNGTLKSATPRNGCNGPIIKNSINSVNFGTITYLCGESLKLTNLFLAWTSASPSETCPLNSALISPKCGTLPEIQINAGVNASFAVTNSTCAGNDGSINMTPSGGKPPYTYSWSASNGGSIPSGQSTNQDLTGLGAGTYTVIVTDANNCSATRNTTVGAPDPIATPAATVTQQPDCSVATGTVTVTSPDNTTTYTLKQGVDVKYTAVNGVFSSVAPGTYALNATKGSCSATGNNVTVNAQPATPAAPSADVTQPTCSVATGTITITAPLGAGITYSINGTDYQTGTTFNNVAPGTYNVTAKFNSCTSPATSKTVNSQPGTPATPTVCIVQPSLCGPATGSVTITSPTGAGLEYSIDNGATWQSSNVFNNLAAGSVTGIKVKNGAGCISDAANCDASNCEAQTISKAQINPDYIAEEQKQTTVKAYPNPFNYKVKFVVTSAQAGSGTLEVFNMLGQKVKTVYKGFVPAGINNFELSLPSQKHSNLIYRFRMGEKQISGKLLQITR